MKKKQILIVDGYNMIGAWPELVKLMNRELMEEARDRLLEILSNYSTFEGVETWCIFDAQLIPGITKEYTKYKVKVVFTAQGETADTYIEGIVDELQNVLTEVTVATSDLAEQQLVFSKGAQRMSADDLYKEIKRSRLALKQESHRFHNQAQRIRGTWTEDQMDLLRSYLDEVSKGKTE